MMETEDIAKCHIFLSGRIGCRRLGDLNYFMSFALV